MQYLRYATAVIISVGPFLDKTDGVTLETGLTITNERITLVAETDDGSAPTNVLDNVTGATSGTSNDLNYITGNDAGMMQLELSAANVNRLGRMRLVITDAANHCPVFHEYTVIPAAIYDAMFMANSGYGDVMLSSAAITVTNQTTFRLSAGSADDDAYNGCMAIITDATTALQKTARVIDDYTGSTKTVVLNAAAGFTIATNDLITIVSKAGAELANLTTHGGTAAKVTAERLIIASTTTNEPGLKVTGNGSAAGTLSTGGATGIGISAVGGATSGSGFKGTGTAGNAVGIEGQGQGSADGLRATGGATGHGINGVGGATSGSGLRGVGSAGNSAGVAAVGQGSAAGLQATGGATGAGIRGTGGATSGAGLVAAAAAGNSDGMTLTKAGTGLDMNLSSTVNARIKKNTAFTNFMIKMELTDGTPGTGLTVTVQRAIDGAAFAALAVTTVTEMSAGWYKFNLAAADVNGDAIAIKATATGAKQRDLLIITQVAA